MVQLFFLFSFFFWLFQTGFFSLYRLHLICLFGKPSQVILRLKKQTKKFRRPLSSREEGGKALMARTLRKIFFLRLPLSNFCFFDLKIWWQLSVGYLNFPHNKVYLKLFEFLDLIITMWSTLNQLALNNLHLLICMYRMQRYIPRRRNKGLIRIIVFGHCGFFYTDYICYKRIITTAVRARTILHHVWNI